MMDEKKKNIIKKKKKTIENKEKFINQVQINCVHDTGVNIEKIIIIIITKEC